jgi:DNA-directed RNA polymerase subunit RPC12/RpoP
MVFEETITSDYELEGASYSFKIMMKDRPTDNDWAEITKHLNAAKRIIENYGKIRRLNKEEK